MVLPRTSVREASPSSPFGSPPPQKKELVRTKNLAFSPQSPTTPSITTDRHFPHPQGGDNKLVLVLGTYHPSVDCRGSIGPEWTSCFDILGDMPADERVLKFGPRGFPEVEQKLPMRIVSGKSVESGVVIDSASASRLHYKCRHLLHYHSRYRGPVC